MSSNLNHDLDFFKLTKSLCRLGIQDLICHCMITSMYCKKRVCQQAHQNHTYQSMLKLHPKTIVKILQNEELPPGKICLVLRNGKHIYIRSHVKLRNCVIMLREPSVRKLSVHLTTVGGFLSPSQICSSS